MAQRIDATTPSSFRARFKKLPATLSGKTFRRSDEHFEIYECRLRYSGAREGGEGDTIRFPYFLSGKRSVLGLAFFASSRTETTRSGLCEDMKPAVGRISTTLRGVERAGFPFPFSLPTRSHEFSLFAVYDLLSVPGTTTLFTCSNVQSIRRLAVFKHVLDFGLRLRR